MEKFHYVKKSKEKEMEVFERDEEKIQKDLKRPFVSEAGEAKAMVDEAHEWEKKVRIEHHESLYGKGSKPDPEPLTAAEAYVAYGTLIDQSLSDAEKAIKKIDKEIAYIHSSKDIDDRVNTFNLLELKLKQKKDEIDTEKAAIKDKAVKVNYDEPTVKEQIAQYKVKMKELAHKLETIDFVMKTHYGSSEDMSQTLVFIDPREAEVYKSMFESRNDLEQNINDMRAAIIVLENRN